MCRGWKGLALVVACGCLSAPARAQYSTYPSAVGAARMPEPIPCGPSATPPPPMPNLVPGPISPQSAPMGPPDSLSLPYDHTSAFQCEEYVGDGGFYVHAGAMALQRNKLGAGDIAVYNATVQNQTLFPAAPNVFVPPPAGTSSASNFNSLTPALSLGIRGTVGYLWDNQSIELSSFYIFQNNSTFSAVQPGDLDTLFYNPPPTFVADGLFRTSDKVDTVFGSSLLSTELNYRRWNAGFSGLELLAGVRYLRQNDALDIVTYGTSTIQNAPGLPTPGPNSAIYEVLTHNNITVAQIGAEYTLPVCRWFSLSGDGRAGWGANYLTSDVSLTRGDGLTGFNTYRHATNFAQVYQMSLFADFHLMDRLRVRLGYTSLWLVGVAAAQDQVDFNLMGFQASQAAASGSHQTMDHGTVNNNGSMIYFGPVAEFQFFF